MCLALPARIVALDDGDQATVDLGGVRKGVSVALTPGVAVGDYVIVHVGHAIGTVDPDEAARTLALFAELAQTRQAAA
ncbi:MAG: HypC/HybG/HupF family hydrogenase formation chaperone [Aquincola sp.]|nr:HypC/HybG/HupF family hydrogenase formation chaperone [Aquincola sp.]